MDELDIDIGTNLNMQLLVGVSNRRHAVQVIGYVKGESLLVTMPRDNGAMARIFPHDEYIIRYFKGRNIIAFKTKILHIAKVPFWYMHLEYPTKLEKVEIRQAERIRLSVTAQTLVEGNKHWSVIRDLSTGGALVIVNNPIGQEGQHVELFFDLKIGDIEREVHLVGMIRNVRDAVNADTNKTEYCYGVEFMDPSEQDMVFVQGFVYEQLLTHRHDDSL